MKKYVSLLLTLAVLLSLCAGAVYADGDEDGAEAAEIAAEDAAPAALGEDASAPEEAPDAAEETARPEEPAEDAGARERAPYAEDGDEIVEISSGRPARMIDAEAGPGEEAEAEVSIDNVLVTGQEAIRVCVPSSARIITNPYGLRVSLDGEISREQIVSAPIVFYSRTLAPVSVTAKAVGEAAWGSEARFVTAPFRVDDAEKDLFVWFEFRNASDESGRGLTWSDHYTGLQNQIIVNMGRSEVLTLPAAQPGEPSYGAFRAFGSMSASPAEGWTEADTVNITVAFTFAVVEE